MKRRNLEHQSQAAVIQWFAYAHKGLGLPEFALFAVPNAGAGAQRGQAGKMKAEGARSGIPDLLLPVARRGRIGLAIEMKAPKGRISDSQAIVLPWFAEQGWRVEVCYSSGAAIDAIKDYLGDGPTGP